MIDAAAGVKKRNISSTYAKDVYKRQGKYCDRVVLLNKGVKLAEGKPKDMIDLYKRVMAESKMEDSPKKEDGHAAIEGVAWKESMILNPDKQESVSYTHLPIRMVRTSIPIVALPIWMS